LPFKSLFNGACTPTHTHAYAHAHRFAQAVADRTEGKYTFMAEHAHSCCTLLARQKFKVGGRWHTWIDYDKYHDLVQKVRATSPARCTHTDIHAYPSDLAAASPTPFAGGSHHPPTGVPPSLPPSLPPCPTHAHPTHSTSKTAASSRRWTTWRRRPHGPWWGPPRRASTPPTFGIIGARCVPVHVGWVSSACACVC
jgi:hypothetical protein